MSRLQGREGRTEQDRRWTAKVTDVRNWFTFAASERVASDDSEQEHYPTRRKIGWAEGEAGLYDPGRESRLPIRFGDRTDPLEDVPVRCHRQAFDRGSGRIQPGWPRALPSTQSANCSW